MKKVIENIFNILIVVLLIWIILMFLYSIFYKIFGLYKTEYLFNFGNTKIFLAEDNIMSPDINKDDIVFVNKLKKGEDLDEDDLIYIHESNSNKLAKIYSVIEEEGHKAYVTRGIQNYYYNKENIQRKDVIGKVSLVIKGWGLSFKIATSNAFTIVVSVLIVIVIIFNKKKLTKSKMRRRKRIKQE